MTPTVDAPAGGDNFTEIADMFATAPGGSKSSESSESAPDAQASSGGGEFPGGEGPSTPPADAPASPSAPPGEGPTAPESASPTSPYALTEDGNSYIVPKNDFNSLSGLKDYATRVQQRFPTAADAETAHFQAADFRAMRADFLSGEDAGIDAVINFFAGNINGISPDEQQAFRSSFLQMAQKVPETLKSINEQAYQDMSARFAQSEIDAAYERAAQTGSEDDLLAAQMLEWGRTGQYRTELPQQDPAKLAEAQFARQQAELAKRETAAYERDFKYFNDTAMDGPKWNAFSGEIDRVLAPIKTKYDPEVFEGIRTQVQNKVIKTLQDDFEWSRDHNNDRTSLIRAYQNAWKNNQSAAGLKPRLAAYQNDFLARVRRVLPSIAAPLVGKAATSAVAAQKPTATQPRTPAAPSAQTAPRGPNGQFQKPAPAEPWDIVADVQKLMRVG